MSHQTHRPIERVVIRFHEEGVPVAEIATRIGKRPGTVTRILEMSNLRDGSGLSRRETTLRPIESVVLRLRRRGEGYGQIGHRLARSGRQVQHIERFARMKLSE